MTRKILFCLIGIMFMGIKAYSASEDYESLGVWCYVNVNLSTDAGNGNQLRYTISAPSEGVVGVQGPGSPSLSNNLGSTVDLLFSRTHLKLASDGKDCQLPIDLLVKKWTTGGGYYTDTPMPGSSQCYYTVILLIEQ